MWDLRILFVDQATRFSLFITAYLNSLKIIQDLIVNFSCLYFNKNFWIFTYQWHWLFFIYGLLVRAVLPKARLNVKAEGEIKNQISFRVIISTVLEVNWPENFTPRNFSSHGKFFWWKMYSIRNPPPQKKKNICKLFISKYYK